MRQARPRKRRASGRARARRRPPSRSRRRCSSCRNEAPPRPRGAAALRRKRAGAVAPAARQRARAAAARAARASRRGNGPAKLFVLDTNVLMHDPTSLFRFEEHDIYLPMITLEELDNHKKGMTEVARNARQASRYLDELAADMARDIADGPADGIALAATGHREAGGKLFLQTEAIDARCRPACRRARPTTRSSASCRHLREQQPKRDVILVSKDINMRIKARALGLAAEDYFNDKMLEDTDLLYTGVLRAAGRFLGHATARTMETLAAGRPHLLPHQRAARAVAADQPVRLPRGARRAAALRAGQRDHRQDRGAADAARTTRTRRTPSGASPRATASRTSR